MCSSDLIKLPNHPGLKPGMSAVVDIVLADHKNVLTVPVAAIIEGPGGMYCWIQVGEGVQKRLVRLGDTNDQFSIVLDGLSDGEEVILNPLSFIEEAQTMAMEVSQRSSSSGPKKSESKP